MQKHVKSGRPGHATLVAYLALFVAIGGSAYAANQLPKNSVGTKQIKKNAVTGAKVKPGSLAGSDIALGSLGVVPNASHAASADTATEATHAVNADHAANADLLGGAGASSYVSSSRVKRADVKVVEPTEGTREDPLLSMGPLTLTTRCSHGVTGSTVGVRASTSASGATSGYGYTTSLGFHHAQFTSIDSTPKEVLIFNDQIGEPGVIFAGEIIYRDPNTTITLTFQGSVHFFPTECNMHGVALQA